MDMHPAYPSPTLVADHNAAVRLATAVHANNARIRTILQRALDALNECDLHGHSMIPGYDLKDVFDTIAGMLPQLDGDAGHELDVWAAEQVATRCAS